MRILVIMILLATAVGITWGITAAVAQPAAGERAPRARPTVKIKDPKDASKTSPHFDRYEAKPSGKQPGLALLFWAFAAASVGGALFVVTRRNLIAAVMGMVGSFLGISAVYMMLYAHFLSVIQMLVYAGAIMVLFVFVIMILNRPEDEPVAPQGRAGQAFAGLAIIYLVGRLVFMLMNVRPPTPEAANAPAQVPIPAAVFKACQANSECSTGQVCSAQVCSDRVDWGSTKAVGTNLFTEGLFPFEAISILLLISVVGAIAIAKPLSKSDGEEGEPS
jgi:NADH-quinone oxidoreductase subunit J